MSILEVSVDVAAPPQRVWSVLSDVAAMPALTPSMTAVEVLTPGPLALGTRARITQPRLGTSTWEVTELTPGRSFTWITRKPGLTTYGRHLLEPRPDDHTGLRLEIEHVGPLAGLARLIGTSLTRRYVRLEAEGLKRASESA